VYAKQEKNCKTKTAAEPKAKAKANESQKHNELKSISIKREEADGIL